MIKINIAKAKEYVHGLRRLKRSEKFSPVDGDSMYVVLNETGENKRKEIKIMDDNLQIEIEECKTTEELLKIKKNLL